MKHQIKSYILFAGIFLASASVMAQPKLAIEIGAGLYEPVLSGFDDNNQFPVAKFWNRNLLTNYGIYYQFFYNARIGYSSYTSWAGGELNNEGGSRPIFFRSISYRMFPIETYFRYKPKIEFNFTLTPIWGRSKIQLNTRLNDSGDDWDILLGIYGNNSVDLATMGSMKSDWLGYSGQLGIRYYIKPYLGLDFKFGFMNNYYSEKKWRLQGNKILGPVYEISKLPIFAFKIVYGLK
ncbi:MAG: hypothetical protein HN657_00195 [Candidatus Marinimicrobia bacterium]|jgi:hypothetical protein|nr:hypothetical protein [Candidatus Neomarinimicrobiota bacterium]MBT3496104.1 hypothetical protein [Candidatus Neomarinimicrobiota bacterium]MBT3691986.1 hypothetical protein [Candidatus Neomarinimicrobiota bacterium]MBT3732194.1 hypothetical protein [Candidatus Neomarinimicrobiota bacterium]MBT4144634.1 hypothetical protein [Candidatus Neomarinimicrobiota bacterium]